MDKIENKKIKTQVSSQIMKKFILVMVAMILIFCGISFLLAKINTESNSYNDMLNAGNVISGIVSDYMDPKNPVDSHSAERLLLTVQSLHIHLY